MNKGFTLIELVITLILLSIISVYAGSKLSAIPMIASGFDADVAASAFRRAQTKAVASNMNIYLLCQISASKGTVRACADASCLNPILDIASNPIAASFPAVTGNECNGSGSYSFLFTGTGNTQDASGNSLGSALLFGPSQSSVHIEPAGGLVWTAK